MAKDTKKFREFMAEYKKQLESGAIIEAYRGLMDYITELRTYFKNKYPDYFVSGIYYGYMDMTYFSFVPQSLKHQKLKVAIVFVHNKFRFEVWLAGCNKSIQTRYWKIFRESNWKKYHIASTTKGIDYIVDYVLVDNPDFGDLDVLTEQIEGGTLKFIEDIENFLSNY